MRVRPLGKLPRSFGLSSTSSTRRLISGVALRPGDEIRIEGKPDGMDLAGLDYVEIVLSPVEPVTRLGQAVHRPPDGAVNADYQAGHHDCR